MAISSSCSDSSFNCLDPVARLNPNRKASNCSGTQVVPSSSVQLLATLAQDPSPLAFQLNVDLVAAQPASGGTPGEIHRERDRSGRGC